MSLVEIMINNSMPNKKKIQFRTIPFLQLRLGNIFYVKNYGASAERASTTRGLPLLPETNLIALNLTQLFVYFVVVTNMLKGWFVLCWYNLAPNCILNDHFIM